MSVLVRSERLRIPFKTHPEVKGACDSFMCVGGRGTDKECVQGGAQCSLAKDVSVSEALRCARMLTSTKEVSTLLISDCTCASWTVSHLIHSDCTPLMHLSAGDVYPIVGMEPLGPFSKPRNPTTRSPPPLRFQKLEIAKTCLRLQKRTGLAPQE